MLSEPSTRTLRRTELESARAVIKVSKIKERKLKKTDKLYRAGVIDAHMNHVHEARRCLESRGRILSKKSGYVKLLGEAK